MPTKTIAEPLAEHVGMTVHDPGGANLLDLDRGELIELFKSSGGVLFEGFKPDLSTFEAFTDQFCSKWIPYQGGAYHKRALNPERGGDIYSVNVYTEDERQIPFKIDWHADMAYIKNGPVFIFLYLIHPAATGGETGLCDGVKLYQRMSPSLRKLFETKRIKYSRAYPDGNWQVRFETEDLDEVRRFCALNDMQLRIDHARMELTTDFVTSALRKTRWGGHTAFNNSLLQFLWLESKGREGSSVRFEDDSRIPEDVEQELRGLIGELGVLLQLKERQVLWVDNTRSLHSRMPYQDQARNLAQRLSQSTDW
jgi:alpha-ketoglutarate-dependent taurine dioxygenase